MGDRYDRFAEEAGLDPEVAASWKRHVAPPAPPAVSDAQWAAAQAPVSYPAGPHVMRVERPLREATDPLAALAAVNRSQPPSAYQQTVPPPDAGPVRQPVSFTRGAPAPRPAIGTTYQAPTLTSAPMGGGGGGMATGPMGSTPGMVKETETISTVKGHPILPEERQARDDARTSGELAAQADYEGAQERGRLDAMAAASRAEATKMYGALESKAQDDHQARMNVETGKLESDLRAVQSGEIDPNHYWENKGTAGKIAAGLGVFLGGLGAAFTGGPNAALAHITHEMDADLDSQKANMSKRRDSAGLQQTLLDRLTKNYGDEERARSVLKAMALQGIDQDLAARMTNISDKAALAKYEQARAGIQQQKAAEIENFQKRSEDQVHTQSQEVAQIGGKYGRGIGGGGGGAPGALNKVDNEDTGKLAKELVAAKVPEANAALNKLQAMLPESGDVPGFGTTRRIAEVAEAAGIKGADKAERTLYGLAGSKEGNALRQAADSLFNIQLKDQSGAAVSDQEMDRFKQAFYGAASTGNAEGMRRALEGYRRRVSHVEATIRSGFNANVNTAQRGRHRAYLEELENEDHGPTEVDGR